MGTKRNIPPEVASLRGKVAAHASWARTEDRAARTAAARKAANDRYTRQARALFPNATEQEIEQRAEHLRREHMTRMALRSAMTRRGRKSRANGGEVQA